MHSHISIGSLNFIHINLHLSQSGLVDVFRYKNNKTLEETLKHSRYSNLVQCVMKNYRLHLNDPLGDFLYQLKKINDHFYKEFLNPYGDEIYSKFGITEHLNIRGLYSFLLENKVVYIGQTRDTLGKRINAGYGTISPKNCYRDGQATNCHINALITRNWLKISLYIYELNDSSKIASIEKELIHQYNPIWNITLIQK